ncbi:response regulator [Desulfovibrio aerotolerans]|uniref:histidine kinase n=1 Tax=Solidesulfovibrio aerotolerans TaxID=295255 RepID=A0A7C9ML21_9BACT|nr:ATP-binding protein [Solidesulfovibrio aerotolerans]MYL85128.1 response regulator [Solidesulfovibrio aerotolerans]
MAKDVLCAEAPRSLKRLLDPLSGLLGIPATVRPGAHIPVWPDPGAEAHAILHREFPERGPCPLLAGTALGDDALAHVRCPLGMTVRQFPVPLRDGGAGVLTLGPYFTNLADRQALCGRNQAADAALHLIPWVSPERHGLIETFYREFAAFAGSAAKAGAAKELFLANMSHELRTPLNGIMGMLSLLLQSEEDARRRQFLELAMNASNQLLGVINTLLDMTTISSGRLTLAEDCFDLHAVLETLFALCAEQAVERGLDFATAIESDVPQFLVGDAQRLRQVLLNLLHNALKFTERGSISVTVAVVPPGGPTDTVTLAFTVRDTGLGIAPDKQTSIFEHFAIGEPFLSKRYAQAGLGLGISKDIVEKMGGSLRLESTPGTGSAFTFTAVLRRPPADPPSLRPGPGRDDGDPAHAQELGAVIVYAEDDPVSQLLVRRILQDRGYVPLIAHSCEQLFDILGSRSVDMVLMDIQMPGLCGLESTRRIRDGLLAGVPRDIPIVALSAATAPADRRLALDAGMTDYIAKPVTRFELLAVVQRALAGKAPRIA